MTQAWEGFQRLSALTPGRQLVDADCLGGKMDLCQQSSAQNMRSSDENIQYSQRFYELANFFVVPFDAIFDCGCQGNASGEMALRR